MTLFLITSLVLNVVLIMFIVSGHKEIKHLTITLALWKKAMVDTYHSSMEHKDIYYNPIQGIVGNNTVVDEPTIEMEVL